MADKVLCEKSDLVAIADAVRTKNGTSDSYKVSQLASAVEGISGGSGSQNESATLELIGPKTITLYYIDINNNYQIVTKDSKTNSLIVNNIVKNSMIEISFGDAINILSATGLTLIKSYTVTDKYCLYQINGNAIFTFYFTSGGSPGKE